MIQNRMHSGTLIGEVNVIDIMTVKSMDGILDINLTKDSSLLLHAIHIPLLADFKEKSTLLWFLKIRTKKSEKHEN